MNIVFILGVGPVPAVRAHELRPKDRIVLDGGHRYTVVLVERSGRWVSVGLRDHAGRLSVMRKREDAQVGLAV